MLTRMRQALTSTRTAGTRVTAVMPMSLGHVRKIVRGAAQRLVANGIPLDVFDTSWQPGQAAGVETDGAICLHADGDFLALLRDRGVAVVNVSARDHAMLATAPAVIPDDRAAGRLAAEHLILQGYTRFAVGYSAPFYFARERGAGFAEVIEEMGYRAGAVHIVGPNPEHRFRIVYDWLESVETPVGVMLADDHLATVVMQACRAIGLGVGREVGLIGVNNDEAICETVSPGLSSIDLNSQGVGYAAASLMLRLLGGEPPPAGPVRIPPAGVVTRDSTRPIVIDDPLVRAAVSVMWRDLARPRTVAGLAGEMGVSKRKLERAFGDALRQSPASYWRTIRLRHAANLLAETTHPVREVARAAGFSAVQHFSGLFRSQFGQPPTDYREARQIDGRPNAEA